MNLMICSYLNSVESPHAVKSFVTRFSPTFYLCSTVPLTHSHVYPDREATIAAALNLAKTIASKSPVAVQGSKVVLNYSRDHSVDESLEYVVSVVVAVKKQ